MESSKAVAELLGFNDLLAFLSTIDRVTSTVALSEHNKDEATKAVQEIFTTAVVCRACLELRLSFPSSCSDQPQRLQFICKHLGITKTGNQPRVDLRHICSQIAKAMRYQPPLPTIAETLHRTTVDLGQEEYSGETIVNRFIAIASELNLAFEPPEADKTLDETQVLHSPPPAVSLQRLISDGILIPAAELRNGLNLKDVVDAKSPGDKLVLQDDTPFEFNADPNVLRKVCLVSTACHVCLCDTRSCKRRIIDSSLKVFECVDLALDLLSPFSAERIQYIVDVIFKRMFVGRFA